MGGQRGQPFALSWVQRSAVQSAGCGDPCRTVISEFGRWGMVHHQAWATYESQSPKLQKREGTGVWYI